MPRRGRPLCIPASPPRRQRRRFPSRSDAIRHPYADRHPRKVRKSATRETPGALGCIFTFSPRQVDELHRWPVCRFPWKTGLLGKATKKDRSTRPDNRQCAEMCGPQTTGAVSGAIGKPGDAAKNVGFRPAPGAIVLWKTTKNLGAGGPKRSRATCSLFSSPRGVEIFLDPIES